MKNKTHAYLAYIKRYNAGYVMYPTPPSAASTPPGGTDGAGVQPEGAGTERTGAGAGGMYA